MAGLVALAWACSTPFAPSAVAAPSVPSVPAQPVATLEADQYSVELEAPVLQVGKEGNLRVTIAPKSGFKFNKEFPTKLELAPPPEGLTAPKPVLKRADGELAADGKFTFLAPLRASRAGEFSIEATLKFSVCNDDKCVVQRQTLRAKVTAQ
jgi:hypothetical protein